MAEVEGTGRSHYRILIYLSKALRAVEQGPEDLPASPTGVRQIPSTRLEVLTEVERQQLVRLGQVILDGYRHLSGGLALDCASAGDYDAGR